MKAQIKFYILLIVSMNFISCNGQSIVTTYSGNGTKALKNGAIDTALFNNPFGLCMDKNGNIYIADNGNNCIRKINTATGMVTTYAGTGVAGWKDGRADTAQFNNPADVCV